MSAPSPCNVTQTPQREFALQRYNKKMIYANKSEKICMPHGLHPHLSCIGRDSAFTYGKDEDDTG